jgi:hypothetical protein
VLWLTQRFLPDKNASPQPADRYNDSNRVREESLHDGPVTTQVTTLTRQEPTAICVNSVLDRAKAVFG